MFSFTPLLDKKINKPFYRQLYEYIKDQILSGCITGGAKLPSLRKLSKDLNLSINTVEGAYQQLYAEGYIESIPRVGYVAVDIHLKPGKPAATYENKKTDSPVLNYQYDLSTHGVDISSFHISMWKKIENSVLNENPGELLRYGDPQGEPELREEIAKYVFETRGAYCTPDQVIIGAGTQYCLGIICQMLRPYYEAVAMESPGSEWLRFIFRSHLFSTEPITYEQKGLNIDELKKSGAKIVFATPSQQILKGNVMPLANRIELLNWAYDEDGIIIEDDYASEVKYFSSPIPSLKSLDRNDCVVYLGSFSKIFIPSIRLSYMILPKHLLSLYAEKFWLYENTTSKLHQKTMARFMKEGYWQKHVRKVKKYYIKKCTFISNAIDKCFGDKAHIVNVYNGSAVLVEIQTLLTEAELIAHACKAGVKIVSVSEYYKKHFHFEQKSFPQILLSFKGLPLEDIEPALMLLNRVWIENFKIIPEN